jgi:hypothetical protein
MAAIVFSQNLRVSSMATLTAYEARLTWAENEKDVQ